MDLLQKNLSALAKIQPDLNRRLAVEPIQDAFLDTPEGPALLHHRTQLLLKWQPQAVEEEEILLFGVSLEALQLSCRIAAWVFEPGELFGILQRLDVSEALLSGRLYFVLGVELLKYGHLPRRTHPLLSQVYWKELTALEKNQAKRAMVVSGGLMVDDCALALQEEGWSCWSWDIKRGSSAFWSWEIRQFQASFALCINHSHGLAGEAVRLGLSFACWEIDPALDSPKPTLPAPNTHVFTWRKQHVGLMQSLGYSSSYLPLSANPKRRYPMVLSPQEQSRYGDEVVFVGRSMILEASNLRKTVMTDLRMALKNLGRDPKQALVVLNEALNLQRMAKDTWILPTLIEQLVPGFSNISTEHDPLATLGEIAGAEYRAGIVASLPGIAVWGDAGWKTLESYGVRYRGEAGHFIELSRIYNNGGIHVDIGRIYQRDIVTLRVFEAAACGAFVLASWSPALRGCFKLGVELESWKNLAELKAKIAFYKANPEKRRAIAEAGRERVLKEHTTLQRVQQILAHMKLH